MEKKMMKPMVLEVIGEISFNSLRPVSPAKAR
jgi:hypothetical protein